MKTVVIDRDVVELEIKPRAILAEYRKLLEQEVVSSLAGSSDLISSRCPGCLSEESEFAFEKYGLRYRECTQCQTLYVSPRPTEVELVSFYRNSKSSVFWRDHILPETQAARQTKLLGPRVAWLLDVVDEYLPDACSGVVVGYHNDLLLTQLQKKTLRPLRLEVTNPIADLEFRDRLPGVSINPMMITDVPSLAPTDVFLAFDILDRCEDPDAILASAYETLSEGGIFLGTATMISGFDLQVLWDRSETIHPPDRLNLFSVDGLTALIERHGFEILEFSTPGVFDVEVVQRAICQNPDQDWPRFVRHLAGCGDEAVNRFQEFLQEFRLSSFARVVLRKIS